ncbi:hypothetical protein CUMW_272070 [Citrus unshiu]|uniref:Uncharacterized protein n=3 Tax=Citrus TaxID=2706 RepID=A0A067DCG1_CITSI|nr:hypothetical protein CISIN_1g039147mg [Citrus sinensis]GAY69445.1 hypothetical protein CUMW_272070 [Citrus unshiu]
MARYLKKHQKRLNARGTCSGTFAPKPLIPQTNSGSECMPFICGPKNRLIPGRWNPCCMSQILKANENYCFL